MAEVVISATVEILLEKLLAVVQDVVPVFGVENELKRLKKSLAMVQAFVDDVTRRKVENGAVRLWLKNLEDVVYEADHLLDEFNYEILRRKVEIKYPMMSKMCFFLSYKNHVIFYLNMARKIKDVNMKLKRVNKEATNYGLQHIVAVSSICLPCIIETDSLSVDPIVVGRANDVSALVDMLVTQSCNETISVVSIMGMGGLGKTTIARLIFNDSRTKRHFDERIWVCVSENFDTTRVLKRILETLTTDVVQLESKQAVTIKLQKKLKDKRYLLVLDDLWNDQRKCWDEFISSLVGINPKEGNFCLVTTRNEDVASIVSTKATYPLDKLCDDDCWSIIKTRAFSGVGVSKELEIIGKDMASRCRGIPLAANMVGGTLRGKGSVEWKSFLHNGFSASNREESEILPVLNISFDRLPSPLLKKCFAYCSILRKGVEIDKERLIQLWMAEGFLIENNENDMENIGSRVYDILLQCFFLQEAVKDEFGNVEHSKMHDLVHDLACLVSDANSFNAEDSTANSIPSQVRYLAIKSLDEEAQKMITKEGAIYLRTLFLGGDMIYESMFKDFKYLHVLNLQEAQFIELPNSVGKLIHLRFLEVSSRKMKSFPESICNLLNLQTLRAKKCFSLVRLPSRFQQLVSLRHLIIWNYQFSQMPREMGKLVCLRTLEFFIVGHEKGLRIEELGYMKHLKGELTIHNLERVNDKEEAARACLSEKSNILKLVFIWSSSMEGNNNHEQVLEGLQPHQNVKSLKIHSFLGYNFPTWTLNMSVGEVFTLDNLIEISLVGCKRCKEIPTLGHLPLLKLLEIDGLTSVKSIGHSFYHPQLHGGNKSSYSQNGPQYPPFRALECFRLTDMTNLVEWIEPRDNSNTSIVDAFPNLQLLEIEECRNMTIVPSHDFPSLKELRIRGINRACSLLLDKICGSSLTSLKIGVVEDFTCLPERLLLNGLESLELYDCRGLTHLEFPDDLQSLHELSISKCHNLKSIRYSRGELISLRTLIIFQCQSLTDLPSNMLESCTSLEMLQISDCDNIASSFRVDCKRMSSLNCLNVSKCPKLRNVPENINRACHLRELHIGPFSKEVSLTVFYEALEGIQQVHSLRTISIYGWPQLDSLPDQLQHLTKLTSLKLYDLGIEALPEWLGNMSCLQELWLYNCQRLRHLPSKEVTQRLTELSFIWIRGCSLLEGMNNPTIHNYDHSEWTKISHVRHVHVD